MLRPVKILVNVAAPLMVCIIIVVVSGCRPSAERQLTGTWRLDAGDAAFGLIDRVNVQLAFARDGKMTLSSEAPIVGAKTFSGTWKFISAKDTQANVAIQWDNEERPKIVAITIVDANTIRLTPPLGPVKAEVPFQRVATAP